MTQRVAVILALIMSACTIGPVPDTPEEPDAIELTSPVHPHGTLACNEACTSSVQCGSWCPICGTGQPGSLNGRCQHGLPLAEGSRELHEPTVDSLLSLPNPGPKTVCDYSLCSFDAQCVEECGGPAICSPRKCDNCGGQCIRLTGAP